MSSASTASQLERAKMVVLLVAALLALVAHSPGVSAKPRTQFGTTPSQQQQPSHVDECAVEVNNTVLELCLRCAKSTKSDIVYPMCCQDREEARLWCDKYMKFGMQ